MRPIGLATILLLAAAIALAAPQTSRKAPLLRLKKERFKITDSIIDFTVDLSTTSLGTGNTLLSPFSITSVLNLLMLGATDNTYRQLRTALKYPEDVDDLLIHQQSGLQLNSLQQRSEGVTVDIANRLFAADRFEIRPKYQADATQFYKASVERLDFINKPSRSQRRINQWVNDHTQGKIPKLLDEPLPPVTRMVATNVVYFNSSWQTPFNEAFTKPREFHISPNKSIYTNMMFSSMTVPNAHFAKQNFTGLALPYSGGRYGMYIFMPDQIGEEPLAQLENYLTADNLNDAISQLKSRAVDVVLPRFKMRNTLALRVALRAMGVIDLFNPSLSSLNNIYSSGGQLLVDEVIHQAIIDVHERGTVAAAATAGINSRGSFSSPRVEMNRPFLFIIRDNKTGVPLFWGRLVRPKPSQVAA